MTNLVDQLKSEEIKELLNRLNFYLHANDFAKGNSQYHEDGYLVIHTWDHNFINETDYVDDYLFLGDYNLKHNTHKMSYLPIYFRFMIEKFGDEWTNKAITYFEKHNCPNRVKLIELLKEDVELQLKANKKEAKSY